MENKQARTLRKSILFPAIEQQGTVVMIQGLEILQILVRCDRFADRLKSLEDVDKYRQDVVKF